MLKLNIGCGADIKEDYINIDVKNEFFKFKPPNSYFIVNNIKKGLSFKDSVFDMILAQDILEHFDKYFVHLIFFDIVRILKINGIIIIRVPDIEVILKDICENKFNLNDAIDIIFGEPLIASNVYTGDFGIHKFIFSKKSLKIFGKKFGINFNEIKNEGYNIIAIGVKEKEINRNYFEEFKVTSWGNRVGMGKPYVTLKEFLEIINNED